MMKKEKVKEHVAKQPLTVIVILLQIIMGLVIFIYNSDKVQIRKDLDLETKTRETEYLEAKEEFKAIKNSAQNAFKSFDKKLESKADESDMSIIMNFILYDKRPETVTSNQ